MTIKIEYVNRNHLEEVIELQQSLSKFKPSRENLDAIWIDFSAQTNVFAIVALSNEEVIGYASLFLEIKVRGGIIGHIEDVVVSSSKRNCGIGKTLIDRLHEIAREQGCYKLTLECESKVIDFYKKCSYEISGTSMKKYLS